MTAPAAPVLATPALATPAARAASPLPGRAAVGLLGVVLGLTVLVLGGAVLLVIAVSGGREHGLTIVALALPVHAVVVLAAVHAALRRAGATWVALGFVRPTARLLHLLWQVPAMIAGLVLVQVGAAAVLGGPPTGGDAVETLVAGVPPVAAIAVVLTVVVLVPLWEEALFRGVVHGGLRRRWAFLPAALVSGGLFALAHGLPVLLPYMLGLGLALALIRERHGTLWAPVLAHAALNGVVSLTLVTALLG